MAFTCTKTKRIRPSATPSELSPRSDVFLTFRSYESRQDRIQQCYHEEPCKIWNTFIILFYKENLEPKWSHYIIISKSLFELYQYFTTFYRERYILEDL
jgi:hypothetical protein